METNNFQQQGSEYGSDSSLVSSMDIPKGHLLELANTTKGSGRASTLDEEAASDISEGSKRASTWEDEAASDNTDREDNGNTRISQREIRQVVSEYRSLASRHTSSRVVILKISSQYLRELLERDPSMSTAKSFDQVGPNRPLASNSQASEHQMPMTGTSRPALRSPALTANTVDLTAGNKPHHNAFSGTQPWKIELFEALKGSSVISDPRPTETSYISDGTTVAAQSATAPFTRESNYRKPMWDKRNSKWDRLASTLGTYGQPELCKAIVELVVTVVDRHLEVYEPADGRPLSDLFVEAQPELRCELRRLLNQERTCSEQALDEWSFEFLKKARTDKVRQRRMVPLQLGGQIDVHFPAKEKPQPADALNTSHSQGIPSTNLHFAQDNADKLQADRSSSMGHVRDAKSPSRPRSSFSSKEPLPAAGAKEPFTPAQRKSTEALNRLRRPGYGDLVRGSLAGSKKSTPAPVAAMEAIGKSGDGATMGQPTRAGFNPEETIYISEEAEIRKRPLNPTVNSDQVSGNPIKKLKADANPEHQRTSYDNSAGSDKDNERPSSEGIDRGSKGGQYETESRAAGLNETEAVDGSSRRPTEGKTAARTHSSGADCRSPTSADSRSRSKGPHESESEEDEWDETDPEEDLTDFEEDIGQMQRKAVVKYWTHRKNRGLKPFHEGSLRESEIPEIFRKLQRIQDREDREQNGPSRSVHRIAISVHRHTEHKIQKDLLGPKHVVVEKGVPCPALKAFATQPALEHVLERDFDLRVQRGVVERWI